MAKAIMYDIPLTLSQKLAVEAAIRRLTNPCVPIALHEVDDCKRALEKLHAAEQRPTR